jgi:hypothetical protein
MDARYEKEVDALFALPLDEFTAARNALAKEARGEGDREAADAIRGLSKPTVSAWALNQVARRERMNVRALVTAGERMLAAQRAVLAGKPADRLRKASEDEQKALNALVSAGERVLAEAERPASAQVRERMARTLRAAAVDSGAREALERGRLSDDLDPSGFGPFEGTEVKRPVGAKRKRQDRAAERDERKREERELREEIQGLRADLQAAEREVAAAERELRQREKAAAKAREQLERALARRES